MRVIRAERGIYVPQNPESPDKLSVRLVETNIIALVPDDYHLPEDSYTDLGKLKIDKKKEKDA